MTLSLYFPCLRLLVTIANLHQYNGQSDNDNGPLASNWPCMAKARNLGQREKESISCRISQGKRETRLQIIEGSGHE